MSLTPAMGISAAGTAVRKRLGHYELFNRFAVGAMAELFLGRARGEEGFEKMVVIKRVLPRLADDTRFMQMLQLEARIHASLSHKNIVQIHDLGLSGDGEYFIVLEYVDGCDLGTLLERGARQPRGLGFRRLDDALGLYIMGEVAEGVHFAHEVRGNDGNPLGLVHRDISPSNILLSYAGEVKLSDFGVAKRSSDNSVVTSIKGELGYISPEQARGTATDRRSDIFSLGAVAFELFTGHPLRHLSGTPDDYLKAASGIVASPLRYRPDMPPVIERLLAGAVAPDPRDRFADARKFVDACREALATISRPVHGEASELRALLTEKVPPGVKNEAKVPSKVISLMPNLWEDVTVTRAPIPTLPPIAAEAAAPAESRLPLGERRGAQVATPAKAKAATTTTATTTTTTTEIGGRARQGHPHNVLWALSILGALLASIAFSVHLYVMPLPVAAVYFRPAFVDVTSDPSGADVYVDGKKILGATPALVEVQRDHREHVVELRSDGYEPLQQRMRYDRDVRLRVAARLTPLRNVVR